MDLKVWQTSQQPETIHFYRSSSNHIESFNYKRSKAISSHFPKPQKQHKSIAGITYRTYSPHQQMTPTWIQSCHGALQRHCFRWFQWSCDQLWLLLSLLFHPSTSCISVEIIFLHFKQIKKILHSNSKSQSSVSYELGNSIQSSYFSISKKIQYFMIITTPFWTLNPSWYLMSGLFTRTSTTGVQETTMKRAKISFLEAWKTVNSTIN